MLYPCPFDHQPCEVVSHVAQRVSRRGSRGEPRLLEAMQAVADCLPCSRCREVDLAVQGLLRTRLGKHERNILLYAPAADSMQGAILDPELTTHAERETYLRAIRKLHRSGLISAGTRYVRLSTTGARSDGSAVRRAYAHRTMRLTPLGQEVSVRYRREMESGRPIRWGKHLEEIHARVRLSTPALLDLFARRLDERLDALAAQAEAEDIEGAHEARQVRYLVQPIRDSLRA